MTHIDRYRGSQSHSMVNFAVEGILPAVTELEDLEGFIPTVSSFSLVDSTPSLIYADVRNSDMTHDDVKQCRCWDQT